MGYSTEGSITKFWPDDTETTMYLDSCSYLTMDVIIRKAKEKWGEDIDFENLIVMADNIMTNFYLYGDEAGDDTDFIVLEYTPK